MEADSRPGDARAYIQAMNAALNIDRSVTGQPWRWRGLANDDSDTGFRPDALVDQLLLTRGCPRDALEAHRQPTIRGFMFV